MAGAQHGNIVLDVLQHIQAVKQVNTPVRQIADVGKRRQSCLNNVLTLALVWLNALNFVPFLRKHLGKGTDARAEIKHRFTRASLAADQRHKESVVVDGLDHDLQIFGS